MRISFENANNTQNVDRVTTTSQESTKAHGSGISSAFALDISGTVMDNSAYEGHGKTAEDVMQNAEQDFMTAQQKLMTVMSNFMSEEDYAELAKNGFDPKDVDAGTIVTVVDEIKTKLAEAGIEIEGYNDDLSAEELAKVTGSASRGQAIAQKLRTNDLPVSKENVAEVDQALQQAEQISGLSDGAKKYLITNADIYAADNQSSGSGKNSGQNQTIRNITIEEAYRAQFSVSGNYTKQADNIDWSQLEKQMEKVIEDAGSEVNEETIAEAKWIIENGIPLTTDSFTRLAEIDSISWPVDTDALLNSIMNAYISGKEAGSASLNHTEPIYEEAARYMEEIEARATLAQTSEEDSLEMVTARRQLEEVRLAMTIEANVKLLASGYSIDTTDLEQLVEDLKAVEQSKKQILFQTEDPMELAAREEQYQKTLDTVTSIPSMPVQVLGKVASIPTLFYLEYIQSEGTALQNQYEAAGETYEALMTAPRADLGDSIRKAFRNVDDILEDLQLEPEEANRRAVRILGYNQMPVTEENLTAVKDADLALQRVVDKLTPAATLQMIRDGVNPLQMNIKELDEYLTEQVTPAEEAEKYSEFLVRLENNKAITAEEKEAYIGVYRLLRQVEKTDGAAIGSIVNQGAELSLRNLMTAVRNRKNSNRDYKIDDSFGERVTDKEISSGVTSERQTTGAASSITDQIQGYYERLVTDAYETIGYWQSRLPEQSRLPDQELIRQSIEEIRAASQVSEDTIQTLLDNDITVTVNNLLATDTLFQSRGSLFGKIMQKAQDNDNAASDSTTGTASETAPVSKSDREKLGEAMKNLTENMTDEASAVSAYEDLVQVSGEVLDHAMDLTDHVIDIRSISNFHKQLTIATKLAKNECFEVPIELNGEKTSINLQIIHQTDNKGMVQITYDTQSTGSVMAQFQVQAPEQQIQPEQVKEDQQIRAGQTSSDLQISGMIVADSQAGLEQLQQLEGILQQTFAQEGCKIDKIYFTTSHKLNINRPVSTDQTDPNNTNTDTTDTTQSDTVTNNTLYRIAKSFLTVMSNDMQDMQIERKDQQ